MHIFEVTVVTVHFFVVTLNSNGNRLTPMDFSFTTETDTTTGAPVVTKYVFFANRELNHIYRIELQFMNAICAYILIFVMQIR